MSKNNFKQDVWDYYKKNKRDFPWRNTTDPYKILVSEMMLQQTQVLRVIPKYIEFLEHFPNIRQLANAGQADVLKVWQGLGYNRRALYLKKLAEIVIKNYNAIIPTDEKELIKLPGIGKNTAGAILAFSFNIPVIFIETNIRRVFIHFFFKDRTEISDKEILLLIEQTVDRDDPKNWYYALMDYGAYLAKAEINPNRKSKHYTKQSQFKGSLRETRGIILKRLLEKPFKISLLEKEIQSSHFEKALDQLAAEGFVKINKNSASLL